MADKVGEMKTKNKGGRPPEGEKAKRSPLNMRTDDVLRARIEQAAAASGRSLTQEVEYRLERSFRDDDVVAAVCDRLKLSEPDATWTIVDPADSNTQPPKDGSWIIEVYDDGSGACWWAWYHDDQGNTGWHMQNGFFDGDGDMTAGFYWCPAPPGLPGWIEREGSYYEG